MLDVNARQLRAFLAVARVGNITRAADTLGLTPSPVGRAIREFEEAVQETLFLRDNRVTAMTEAADRILPFVVAALAALGGLVERTPAQLRLGTSPDISEAAKERLLGSIYDVTGQRASHRTGAADELARDLQFGELDLLFTAQGVDATGLTLRPLGASEPAASAASHGSLAWRSLDTQNIDHIEAIVEAMGGGQPGFSREGESRDPLAWPTARTRKAARPAAGASIDVADVRVMVAISRHRHLREAAERLGLTPSPVGRTLREIEVQLGAPLFTRDRNEFEPTQLMTSLLPRAVEVLALIDVMAPGEPMLRVGFSFWSPVRYRDRLLAGAAAGGLPRIDMVEATQHDLAVLLLHGEIDLLVQNSWTDLEGAVQRRLGALQLNVFSADEPVTTNPVATLADLGNRTVIALPRETAPNLYGQLERLVGADRVYVATAEQLLTIDSRMRRTGAVMLAAGASDTALRHLLDRPGIVSVPLGETSLAQVNVDAAWRGLDLVRADQIEVAFRTMQPADGGLESL